MPCSCLKYSRNFRKARLVGANFLHSAKVALAVRQSPERTARSCSPGVRTPCSKWPAIADRTLLCGRRPWRPAAVAVRGRSSAFVRNLVADRGVIVRINDHRNAVVVFGGAAQHRGPPMSMFSIASSSGRPASQWSVRTDIDSPPPDRSARSRARARRLRGRVAANE